MCNLSEEEKIKKIFNKALKLINKEIYKSTIYLGRYCVRDCFTQIKKSKQGNFLEIACCFEFVDKASEIKKFYAYSTTTKKETPTIDSIMKILKSLLQSFITITPMHPKGENGKNINYRWIKLD